VFQSGSSPDIPRPSRRVTGAGVRKSSGKSTTSRRKTVDTPDSEMPPPTPFREQKQAQENRRKSYMPPISALRTSQSFQEALSRVSGNQLDALEPGEEFAPSEEVSPPKPRRKSGQIKPVKKKATGDEISDTQLFLWCLTVILAGFYFMFWRQEKFIVGFCGVPHSERTPSH